MNPSNREKKRLNAIKHNEAYLESKKPKPPKEHAAPSRDTRIKAQTLLAISAGLGVNLKQYRSRTI